MIRLELAADSHKPDSVVLVRNPQSSKDIGKTTRSPIDTKSPSLGNADVELAVQVRVEQTVLVEYRSQDHESDHHQKPSEAWDFPSWPVRYMLSAYIFGSDIIETSFRSCLTWPIIYGQGRLLLT